MLSLEEPAPQFAGAGLVGKAKRAQNTAWESDHPGDIG